MNKRTWNLFTLLSLTLTCIPLGTMQSAAELRPDNLRDILSGIEALQDGTARTLDQVHELVNDTIENTNFIQVLCTMPEMERTQLLNDFNITLYPIAHEESSTTPPVQKTEAATLPHFVLEFFLTEIGFVDINKAPLCGILNLPPEMIYNIKPTLPTSYRRQCELTEYRGQKLQFTKIFVSPIKNYIVAILEPEERALVFRPDGQLIAQLSHKWPIRCCKTVQFLGSDEYIVLWTEVDRAYYLFDIEGNHILPAGCRSYDYRGLKCVSVSPKGSFIAINDSTYSNVWRFYDREMQPLSLDIPSFKGYNSRYKSICWSKCEQYIYASLECGYWDIFTMTGRKIDFVLPSREPVYCKQLKLSPLHNLVLIKDREGVMHLFDLDGNFLWSYSNSKGRPYKWCKSYQCDNSMGLFAFQREDEIYELLNRKGKTVEIKLSATELLQPSSVELIGEEKNILLVQTTDGLCILFNVMYENDEVELTYHKTILSFNGAALQGHVIKISQKGNYFVVQGLRGRCYLYTCNGDRVNLEQWDSRPSAYRSIQINPTETYILTRDQNFFAQYREMNGRILGELKADSKFEAKAQTRMVPYNHTILTYNREHNITYYAVVFNASIFSLSRWGMNPHQLLLHHLLAGMHSNWKKNYPRYRFMPCPADITCALLLPHKEKMALMDDLEKKAVVKQTHTWVNTVLNSTKSITQGNQTLYGYLQQKYNLQNDPVVRHPNYEGNGLIAEGYLVPYVRLRQIVNTRINQ